MTIDEAITELKRMYIPNNLPELQKANKARNLGIEALVVLRTYRGANFPWATPDLPGETKE